MFTIRGFYAYPTIPLSGRSNLVRRPLNIRLPRKQTTKKFQDCRNIDFLSLDGSIREAQKLKDTTDQEHWFKVILKFLNTFLNLLLAVEFCTVVCTAKLLMKLPELLWRRRQLQFNPARNLCVFFLVFTFRMFCINVLSNLYSL
jgi:hypothetical protein